MWRENTAGGTCREITIDAHYEGPPNITQGGYLSGLMAVHLDTDTVEVTMFRPTPMNKPLTLDTSMPNRVYIRDGDTVLNEAKPTDLFLEIPAPITMEQARKASRRHITTPAGNCLGCGSLRSEANGLHLRSGPVEGRDVVGIDWVPRGPAVEAQEGETVPEPIVWASMECPTARAMELGSMKKPEELFVLGRIATKVNALPRVGDPCFFMGWPLERVGRKIQLGGSLHDEKGQILVLSRLTFIVLKEGVTYDSLVGKKG